MRTQPDYFYNQSAVIPFRFRRDKLEVLLITSRRRKRWIIPKGIVEQDLTLNCVRTEGSLGGSRRRGSRMWAVAWELRER